MKTALPHAWIERVFTRLQGIYGREFLSQYGTGMVGNIDPGIENAKVVWAEELGGFERWPEAIGYALENLPDRAPNCIRFREICRNAPMAEQLKLEHRLTDAQMAENKKKVREMIEGLKKQISTKGEVK